jgi:hypothetical protein
MAAAESMPPSNGIINLKTNSGHPRGDAPTRERRPEGDR